MLNEGDQKQIPNAKDPGLKEGASTHQSSHKYMLGPRWGEKRDRKKGGIARVGLQLT